MSFNIAWFLLFIQFYDNIILKFRIILCFKKIYMKLATKLYKILNLILVK